MIEIRQDGVLLQSLKRNYAIWHFIRYQRIANIVNEMDGRLILDVGCGIGLQGFLLKNKTVIGVDLSLENIKEAKRVERSIEPGENASRSYLVADLYSLPLRKTFDIILCSEVLEHLEDDERAVSGLLSLLKDNGFLIVTLPNFRRFAIGRLVGVGRYRHTSSPHLREYMIGDVYRLSRTSSARIDKIHWIYLDFPPFTAAHVLFKILRKCCPLAIFRYQIYSALLRLYARSWLRLEELLCHHAFYILSILKKLPANAALSCKD